MNKLVVTMMAMALLAIPTAAAGVPEQVKPDDVKLTSDSDDVEFCSKLGEVKAKSGWGGAQGSGMGRASVEVTLRKRAAAAGGNVALVKDISTTFGTSGSADAYQCSAEAMQKQQVRAVEDARKAAATITCTAGTDCEVRWSRVTTWLQEHAKWKFRNVTETLITTEGPLETASPAYEVTKIPVGDGKTYKIAMRAFCGVEDVCDKLILKLRVLFHDAITAPIEVPGPQP